MIRRRTALALALVVVACGEPYPAREFDCAAIADAYSTDCATHLGISFETTACEALRTGQNQAFAPTVDRAAAVCEQVSTAPATPAGCDAMFVCLDDAQGLSAVARAVRVTGTAIVEGELFTLESEDAWAWIGTTMSGNPGDFEVLFTLTDRSWYFRLDDFAERARVRPFAVDLARPIKLENSEDNLELATGTVTVTAFSLDGSFDIAAAASDPLTGEAIDLRFFGSFAAD
jgi:hypothetical protein